MADLKEVQKQMQELYNNTVMFKNSVKQLDDAKSSIDTIKNQVDQLKESYNKLDDKSDENLKERIESIQKQFDKLNNNIANGKYIEGQLNQFINKLDVVKNEIRQINSTGMSVDMQDVQQSIDGVIQRQKILDDIFSKINNEDAQDLSTAEYEFNNIAQIINDVNKKAISLKDNLKNIKIGDTAGIENIKEQLNQLDSLLKNNSKYTQEIIRNYAEFVGGQFNSYLSTESYVPLENEGGTYYTASDPGPLKQDLNDIIQIIKELREQLQFDIDNDNVKELKGWFQGIVDQADEFIKQTDIIEYKMGVITRFGSQESPLKQLMGFKIDPQTVQPLVDFLEQEKEIVRQTIDDLKKSIALKERVNQRYIPQGEYDEKYYNYLIQEQEDRLKSLEERKAREVDAFLGKSVTGYQELYTRTKQMKSEAEQFSNYMTEAPNFMWQGFVKEFIDELKTATNQSGELLYKAKEIDEEFKDIQKLSFQQYKDLQKMMNTGIIPDKYKTAAKLLEDAKNNAKQAVSEQTNISRSDVLDEIASKLEKIREQGVLDKEIIDNILNSKFNTENLDKYKKKLDSINYQFEYLQKTRMVVPKMADKTELDTADKINEFEGYRNQIKLYYDQIKDLEKEWERLKNLKDLTPDGLIQADNDLAKFQQDLNSVTKVLQNRFRLNLMVDQDEYKQILYIEDQINRIKEEQKNVKINPLSDADIEKAYKFNEVLDKYEETQNIGNRRNRVIANYDKYAKDYNDIVNQEKYLEELLPRLLKLRASLEAVMQDQSIKQSKIKILTPEITKDKIDWQNTTEKVVQLADALKLLDTRIGQLTKKDKDQAIQNLYQDINKLPKQQDFRRRYFEDTELPVPDVKILPFRFKADVDKQIFKELRNLISNNVKDVVKQLDIDYYIDFRTVDLSDQQISKLKDIRDKIREQIRLQENANDLSAIKEYSKQYEYIYNKLSNKIKGYNKQIEISRKTTLDNIKNFNINQYKSTGKTPQIEENLSYVKSNIRKLDSGSPEYIQALKIQYDLENKLEKKNLDEIKRKTQAYNEYINKKKEDLNLSEQIQSKFNSKQLEIKRLNTSGLDAYIQKIQIVSSLLEKALRGQDTQKINSLWEEYTRVTDKVIGRIKAREMAESQAIQKNIAEVRNYVQTQETLTGKKMQSSDQAAYYESQLSKFKQSQQEYMEVLRLKHNAEAQAAADTRNAWSTILSSVKQAADAINNAVNKIISVIRTVIQIYQKFGKAVVTVFKTVGGSVKNLLTFFSGFGNRLRSMFTGGTDNANKFNKSFGLIQGTATELRSKLLLVSGALNQIFNNELINKAKRLLSSVYQLKTMTGPAITQDVIDWANSMEHAFGLQARGLIADLSELTGVLYGLGMSGEDVAIGSENLLIMSRYLANMGAAGGDLQTIMTKIVSGMKGMTQAIDDLGLSVRDSQMNQFLKDLKAQGGEFANISTDFQSLNEQARVYVRYAALINQFTRNYDVTKLVESLNTVTGRLSTLKDTWNSLILTIGTGLTKLASMAATYIIPILKIIETKVIQLFSWLEKTLGLAEGQLSTELTPSINDGASEAVNDYNNQLGETADKLDEVNKASKKASGGLQSFDRVNNVTTSKSSDSSQGLDDFDYSSLMTSMLGKLNDMAAQASQSFFEGLNQNLENKIEELKQKLLDFAKNITGRANIDFGFDEKAIKTNLNKVKNDIIKIVKSWGTFVLAIGFKIADDVNIGAIITKVTELLAAFTNLASTMTDVLIPAFHAFYDTGLSKMFTWLGSTALNGLQLLIDTFNDWSDWFIENQTLILNFFTALGTIFSSVWTVISGKLDSGFGSLSEQFKAFTDNQQSGLVTWMTDIVTNVDSIASDASTKVSNFLDTVGTKLEWVSDLISGALETLFTGQVPEDATGGYASFYNILLDIKSVVEAIGGGIGIALGLQSPEEASDGALTFYNLLVNVQSIIQTLTPLVLDLVEAFNDFAAENILPFINDKLSQLDTWLKNNSDKVKTLLETVGNIAWDGFKLFVDLTGKLIDYVVQNPDVVVTFFSSLLALKVGSWFVSGAAGIGNMTLGLSNLGTAVSTVGPQITTAFAGINTALSGTVFGSASAALGGLVQPLTLVVALVVGLVAAFVDLWNTSEDFRAAFGEMADTLKSKIDALAKQFGEGSKFSDALKHLKSLYDTYLKPVLQVLFEIVGYLATGVLGTLIDWIGLLVGGAQQVLDGLLTQLEGFIDLFVGFLTKDDAKMQEGLLKIGEGIYKVIEGIFGTLIGLLGQLVSNLLTFLWNAGKQIIDKVKEVFGISGSISTVFANIGKNLIAGIKDGISYGWKSLTTFINNKIDGFKKIFEDFADSVGGFFDDIWTGFTDGVSAGWSTVTGAVTDGWNFITGKTKASNAQSITSHANGGSIAGGHLFIANENGVPEMIGKIPGSSKTNVANNQMITDAIFEAVYNAIAEASNQRASVGSTNNSPLGININGFGLIDQSTLQQLARMLAPYLGANNRNIANVNFSI